MKTYTTVQGDIWDKIAYNQLGDTAYTDLLIRKNLAYREYFIFPTGVTLVLPEISATQSSLLPPWKQSVG